MAGKGKRSRSWWIDCDVCIPFSDGSPRQHAADWAMHRRGPVKHVTRNRPTRAEREAARAANDAEWRGVPRERRTDRGGAVTAETAYVVGAGRVYDADGKVIEPTPPKERKGPSGAKVLLSLADAAGMALIRDQLGQPWAKLPSGAITPITKGGVGGHLLRLYYEANGDTPPRGAVDEAVDHLKGLAVSTATSEPVYLRFGPLPDDEAGNPTGVAIDLGTDDYTAIVITATGWTIERHPVNFRRTAAMRPLPEPKRGANPEALETTVLALFNVPDRETARFIIAYWVAALKPTGPSVGLGFTGPQGSAKTMAARMTRHVLDPIIREDGGAGVSAMKNDERDFATMAMNNAMVVIDNLSGLSPQQADWIAQLATGFSGDGRTLFTDADLFMRAAKRPVILNGIDLTDRTDVLSRLMVAELLPLPSVTTERKLWRTFDSVHALILGRLCDVVAAAIRNFPDIPDEGWTVRMADVAQFVTAAEPELGWEPRSFEKALRESQEQSYAAALGQQSWYTPLVAVLRRHGGAMTVEPTKLLDELRDQYARDHARSARDSEYTEPSDYPRAADVTWPKNAKAMTDALKRNTAGLARAGITWAGAKSNGARLYTIALDPSRDDPEGEE